MTTPMVPGEPTDESTPTPTDVCEPVETTSTVPGTTIPGTTVPGTTVAPSTVPVTTLPEHCVSTPPVTPLHVRRVIRLVDEHRTSAR